MREFLKKIWELTKPYRVRLSFSLVCGVVAAQALVHVTSITGLTCKLVTQTFNR
jgi:hypothetical protein